MGTNWVDGENKYDIKTQADEVLHENVKFVYKGASGTPLSATYMNKIELGIEQAAHTGSMKMWPTKWVPDGWLERDGSSLSRTTYADLFAALTHPRTVTVTIASPAVFTLVDHGFTAGDAVRFETTGALPTGLSVSTTYYVLSSGLTDDEFKVSNSVGGAAVNTSGSQNGTHTVRYFGVAGVGDGSSTFTLPDDRGYHERAWDHGRGVDTDRVFGSAQDDDVKAHGHTYTTSSNGSHTHNTVDYNLYRDPETTNITKTWVKNDLLYSATGSTNGTNYYTTSSAGAHTHTGTTDNNGATTETRGKNKAYMPIIKY